MVSPMGDRMNQALGDQALRLAEDGFEEKVESLIAEARGDTARLAMAAARLSTTGRPRGTPKSRSAFALLIQATHRASNDESHLEVVG